MSTTATDKTKDVKVTEDDLKDLLGGFMGQIESENAAAYARFSALPAVAKAVEAAGRGDFDGFRFALSYPFEKMLDGLLAKQFPTSRDARYLMLEAEFVERQFERLIQQYEGSSCCVDKARHVMRKLLKFLTTGQRIEFDRTAEYTYMMPTKVFTDHDEIVGFFNAVQRLHYGYADLYLQALLSMVKKTEAAKTAATDADPVARTED